MRRVVYSLITLMILGGLTGCGVRTPVEANTVAPERVRIPVKAELPVRQNISAYFETTTRVQAENRVEVISRGMGECVEVKVEEGDKVKLGDVLALLETRELEAQLQQTRVNVQQTKYQMQKAEEQFNEGLLSQYEVDNARFMHEQALATLNIQEVQLSNQTIRAPIDGVVTQRNIQQGMMIATGIPIFSIVDPNSYFLPISPPERELQRLRIGQEARVTIDSIEGREFIARLRRINPSVDPLSGTVRVTLDFDEADREFLREAAFARVRLVMETHENALVVPKDSIIEENARHYLMVLREITPPLQEDAASDEAPGPQLIAERVEIQTGLEDSNNIEILAGIDDNTRIVTLGQHTLKAGSEVVVTDSQEAIFSKAHKTPEEALAAAIEKQRNQSADNGMSIFRGNRSGRSRRS